MQLNSEQPSMTYLRTEMRFESMVQNTPVTFIDQIEERPTNEGVLQVTQQWCHSVGHIQDTSSDR